VFLVSRGDLVDGVLTLRRPADVLAECLVVREADRLVVKRTGDHL
jgi:hypothetical protein